MVRMATAMAQAAAFMEILFVKQGPMMVWLDVSISNCAAQHLCQLGLFGTAYVKLRSNPVLCNILTKHSWAPKL